MKPVVFLLSLVVLTILPVLGNDPSPTNASDSAKKISLQQCLEMALEHNPDLRIASTQFLATAGQVVKLHAILYPTLQTQALSTPTTFYVQFNQTLYSHATFPQLRLSRLSESQAFINYNQVLTDVVFQVRQAFTAVLGARQRADLLKDYADRQVASLTSAQQLFDAGKTEKNTILSIQVKGNLARQTRAAAELAYTQAVLALDQLIGVELPKNAQFVGRLIREVPTALHPDSLTAEALHNRPDLKLLESLKLSSEQQIQIDQKNAYPIVSARSNAAIQPPSFGPTGGFDLERNYDEPNTQRQPGNTQLPLTLYASWQIFDGGRLEGIKRSGQALLATREDALAELKRSIPGEVASAVAVINTEHDTLQMMSTMVSPEDLRHTAQLDYEAGRVRQLDKANLEDTILQQQQLLLDSEIRLSLATAALDHALGRGLETSPPPAPGK